MSQSSKTINSPTFFPPNHQPNLSVEHNGALYLDEHQLYLRSQPCQPGKGKACVIHPCCRINTGLIARLAASLPRGKQARKLRHRRRVLLVPVSSFLLAVSIVYSRRATMLNALAQERLVCGQTRVNGNMTHMVFFSLCCCRSGISHR